MAIAVVKWMEINHLKHLICNKKITKRSENLHFRKKKKKTMFLCPILCVGMSMVCIVCGCVCFACIKIEFFKWEKWECLPQKETREFLFQKRTHNLASAFTLFFYLSSEISHTHTPTQQGQLNITPYTHTRSQEKKTKKREMPTLYTLLNVKSTIGLWPRFFYVWGAGV